MSHAGLGFQYTLTGTFSDRIVLRAVGSNNSFLMRRIVCIRFRSRIRNSGDRIVVGVTQWGIVIDLRRIVLVWLVWVKYIIRADVLVVSYGMMLGVVIALVETARFSVYIVLFLLLAVAYPKEAHVECLGTFLLERVVREAESGTR